MRTWLKWAMVGAVCLRDSMISGTAIAQRGAVPLRQNVDSVEIGIVRALRATDLWTEPGVTVDAGRLRQVARQMRPLAVKFMLLHSRLDAASLSRKAERIRQRLDRGRGLEFRHLSALDDGRWTTRTVTTKTGEPAGYEEIVDAASGKPISPKELDDKVFRQAPLIGGDRLKPNARAAISGQSHKIIIFFEFEESAKKTFEDITRAVINKRLAIFFDRRLLSAPRVNEAIPGEGVIEGNFTLEEARALARQLNSRSKTCLIAASRTAVAVSGASVDPTRLHTLVRQATSRLGAGDITGAMEQLAREMAKK